MTPEEYELVVRVFTAACDLPAAQRDDYVAEACRGHLHLRDAVLTMLAEDNQPGLHPSHAQKNIEEALHATLDAGQTTTRDVPSHRAGAKFAGYELLSVIGQGGMGVVYKARQLQPNRTVAIKMIRAGRFASAADIQRFHAEAQAAANLHHEGIVPIYEVGEQDGEHFFSMHFIEGQSLSDFLRPRDKTLETLLALFRAVCDAVAAAHEKGIVHRDLKPSNILLDQYQRPCVTDFGLVKQLHQDSTLTTAGDIMGTPGYMSPEQATGGADRVTAATDVYSLGAILYQMLTGRPPILANPTSLLGTLRRIEEHDVASARSLNRKIPRDLDTICMKCLQPDPQNRYADAAELAAEVRRYLDGEPIQARPLGVAQKVLRWARRKPGLATTWAAVATFYLYHSLCHYVWKEPGETQYFHSTATIVAVCWCLGAWVFQYWLNRSGGRTVFLFLWASMDVILLTILLFGTDSAHSGVAMLYHALVAGAVLRFRVRLVVYLTALSLVGYLTHVVYTVRCRPELNLTRYEYLPFVITLLIIGAIQYFALRRIRAAYETSPYEKTGP